MERLRKTLSNWARTKAIRDEMYDEITYKKTLIRMKHNIKGDRTKEVLVDYEAIYERIKPVDNEIVTGYILEELKRLFKQNNTLQASMILQAMGTLNTELFHRAKSLFADYLVRVSSKHAKDNIADYISTMMNVQVCLDPKNSFNLRKFIDELCGERVCAFKKETSLMNQRRSGNTKKEDLLKIDKWINQCTRLLAARDDFCKDLSRLYDDMVVFYLTSCIENIILIDTRNGSEDLLFLVTRLIQRAKKVKKLDLTEKIKDISQETGILTTEQVEGAMKA